MPFQINIGNFKSNNVARLGIISFGASVHNSHTANSKYVGLNVSNGDLSPSLSYMNNLNLDPDVSDQDQIANPSFPSTAQL